MSDREAAQLEKEQQGGEGGEQALAPEVMGRVEWWIRGAQPSPVMSGYIWWCAATFLSLKTPMRLTLLTSDIDVLFEGEGGLKRAEGRPSTP